MTTDADKKPIPAYIAAISAMSHLPVDEAVRRGFMIKRGSVRTFQGETGEDWVWSAAVPFGWCPNCKRTYAIADPCLVRPAESPAWWCTTCRVMNKRPAARVWPARSPEHTCPAPTPHTGIR